MPSNDAVSGGQEPGKSPMERHRSLIAAEEGTGRTMKLLTDSLNALYVKIRSISRLIWTTDTSFLKGIFTQTAVNGTGDAAGIILAVLSDNDDNIPYTVPGSYTLSDGAKLEVAAGQARLKSLSGDSMDWPFAIASNYVISDETKAQVLGGVGLLRVENVEGHWHLNESSGSDVADSSGKDNDGVATNMEDGDWVAAKLNNGLLFGGTDEFVNLSDIADFERTDPFSIEFWFKTTTSGVEMIMSRQLNSGTFRGWNVFIESGIITTALISDNAVANRIQLKTNLTFNDGVFHHCVVTYDGSSTVAGLNIFIDGSDVATTNVTDSLSTTISVAADCQMSGRSGANVVYNGTLDEVVIYSFELSSANVTSRYNSGTGTETLVGSYPITIPIITPTTTFAFISALGAFVETSIKPGSTELNYQITSDNGTTWKYWNGSAWVERQNVSLPTGVTTSVGTVTGGNLASLQAVDADTYDVSEVTGTPGLTTQFDFSNVSVSPVTVNFQSSRVDPGMQVIDVEIWNFISSAWDDIGNLPVNGPITLNAFTVGGTPSDYIQAGVVQVRLNHPTSGAPAHNISIDQVFLSSAPTTEWWNDNQTNSASVINTNISTLAVSGTFNFIAFLDSVTGNNTPSIDNIFVSAPVSYSTDDNLYIDTKDASQVDPAINIAWLSAAIISSIPANTDARVLLSTNSRVSWLTWSGSAWIAPTSDTTRTDATSLADAVTNFASLDLGNGTLDVRLFLRSTDNSVRPTVSNINVISDQGSTSSGNWESNIFDSGVLNLNWGLIGLTLILNGGTVTLRAKAANDLVTLAALSYGSPLNDSDDAGVVGQFIQFKLELSDGVTTSPFVDEISVQYVTPAVQDIGA